MIAGRNDDRRPPVGQVPAGPARGKQTRTKSPRFADDHREFTWAEAGHRRWAVPLMLVCSAVMMSLAWLGHLRFEDDWSFWTALAASWSLVLPEYALNTVATRWGYGYFSGAQMAAVHLSSGVFCVALVSSFVLEEPFTLRQGAGYAVMLIAIALIFSPKRREERDG